MAYRRLPLPEGFVEYVVDGPDEARDLLIFHSGTPTAAVSWAGLVEAASAAGMRVASYSRGGYGASPRREGRTVADEAAITAALADRLGSDRFFTVGWSGGGPAALACAALLPDRVRASMSLAGIAPLVEAGAAWRTFWTPEQLKEWDEVEAGDIEKLIPDFEATVEIFGRMTRKRLHAIGGPMDDRGLRLRHDTEVEGDLIRAMRRSVVRGYLGYLDDNLAQARDWGFRVADIRAPVIIRQGGLDRLVPPAGGHWLAAAIPGARGVFLGDAGHGSIALPWSEVVADLVAVAR